MVCRERAAVRGSTLARAGSTYTKSNGNHLGAAITYSASRALPLILLSISVAASSSAASSCSPTCTG